MTIIHTVNYIDIIKGYTVNTLLMFGKSVNWVGVQFKNLLYQRLDVFVFIVKI